MRSSVGDKIVIEGRHLGQPRRDAVVLEVRGPGGEPPYVVRWADDGHEGLFFPGTDAHVVHFERGQQG